MHVFRTSGSNFNDVITLGSHNLICVVNFRLQQQYSKTNICKDK